MSEQELPQEGGRYIRQPDGSLKRVEDAPAEPKPAARSSTKKDK